MNKKIKGLVMATVVVFIGGPGMIFLSRSLGAAGLDAMQIFFCRVAIGSATVVAISLLPDRLRPLSRSPTRFSIPHLGLAILSGLAWSGAALGAITAVLTINAAVACFTVYLFPVGVAAVSLLRGQRFQKMVYGAIVISVIGGYLNIAATPGISGWLSPGIIWAIFSCFSLVVLMVLTEFLSRRYHATAIATVQQITGTVVATAVLVLLALSRHRPFFPSLTATAWLQALILGTACGALYGLLITATLRYLTATTLSTWMYIEPSLATLFASWWYHEGLAPLAIVGCLMIILGGVTIAKVGH